MENEVTQAFSKQIVLEKEFNIYGDSETPLFLAKDVAEWIEYPYVSKNKQVRNVSQMMRMVDDDEKLKKIVALNNVTTTSKVRKTQESWFLTEDGLYEVLMQSRKPIAKMFKEQVKDILQTIRKHGMYVTQRKLEDYLDDPDSLIELLLQTSKQLKRKKMIENSLD